MLICATHDKASDGIVVQFIVGVIKCQYSLYDIVRNMGTH